MKLHSYPHVPGFSGVPHEVLLQSMMDRDKHGKDPVDYRPDGHQYVKGKKGPVWHARIELPHHSSLYEIVRAPVAFSFPLVEQAHWEILQEEREEVQKRAAWCEQARAMGTVYKPIASEGGSYPFEIIQDWRFDTLAGQWGHVVKFLSKDDPQPPTDHPSLPLGRALAESDSRMDGIYRRKGAYAAMLDWYLLEAAPKNLPIYGNELAHLHVNGRVYHLAQHRGRYSNEWQILFRPENTPIVVIIE